MLIVVDDKVGAYRLLRQIGGHGAFGEVHVVVGPAPTGAESTVIWAVDEANMSSVQPDTDPLDASAAMDGAAHGLMLAESLGASAKDQVVRVTHVGINVADTEPSALRAAAAAAVIRAFGLEDRCQLIYENEWRYVEASQLG
jgi:hypothetical protein